MRNAKIALVGLLLAVVGTVALVGAGPVAAQEQLGNETTVPGVDAGENRTVTTEIQWNASATTSDTATIEIEHVLADGTVNDTTTETVNATPGEWSTTETTLSPSEDVDQFSVNVTADSTLVDDVQVSDDAASGGGGAVGGGSSGGAVGGIVVGLVVVGGFVYWRRR